MKVYIFYRANTESDVAADNFLRLFHDRQAAQISRINVDTRDGDGLSRLYSIMSYPTVMVATDDGQQVRLWHGSLPLAAEVSLYLN